MAKDENMTTDEKLAMGAGAAAVFLVPALLVLVSLPILLFRAWVASKLWAWYVVPGFGVPNPGIMVLFGVIVLLNVLRYRVAPVSKDDRGPWASMGVAFLVVTLTLLIGWVGTLFM